MTDIRDRIYVVELADGSWLEDCWDGAWICHREDGTLYEGNGEIERRPATGEGVCADLWDEAVARNILLGQLEELRQAAAELLKWNVEHDDGCIGYLTVRVSREAVVRLNVLLNE
ncbi:MAG: hypothetical protein UY48_C0038G0003 [Candidatus Gottesmanbacteria bacterium GW2011_GWB1_49_7]|uniref:Uncharacterized protein n=1 Tax=Candidatus Gottesmanbacteria bacterium GW2011_GWB1_49_7 TaxID=1618448 RepID=A0A0G1VV79_9BACT|nr:MAG: hypothetical protein UY48_C0038G0003 [Candidatus Gottesmanbacteria bacterium GW2011_GWB1_49_7]